MKRILFFTGILFVICSCHRNNEVPAITGIDYFPTDVGRYWIYHVHSIKYNSDTTDTTFQVKEVIHDTFHFQGVVVYELYRFYRPDSTQPWPFQPDSVWSFTTDMNQIAIKEASTEFIRLQFPLSVGEVWNGNLKNTSDEDDYTVKTFGTPFAFNNRYLPQTCTVEEANTLNLVNKDYRSRVYAKDIGLIYKNYEFLSYNTDPSQIGKYTIDFGSLLEETLIAYGIQ